MAGETITTEEATEILDYLSGNGDFPEEGDRAKLDTYLKEHGTADLDPLYSDIANLYLEDANNFLGTQEVAPPISHAIVEEALLHIDEFHDIPPAEVVEALNAYLKEQGYTPSQGSEWGEETNEALTAYMAVNHDKFTDPVIAEIARKIANTTAGSLTPCEVIDPETGAVECSTRGFSNIPVPILPCDLNDKESGCIEH